MFLKVVSFLFLVSLVFLPAARPDLADERSALLELRSTVGGRTLLWNVSNLSPCFWAGVTCESGRVTALRLPGTAVSGELPEGIFGNLSNIRTLSLRLNSLSGRLPDDLAKCGSLRNLYLQGNGFSGEVPKFLFGLNDLVRVNLAGNDFSGEISAGFGNLSRLKTLYLENNRFRGSVPELKLPNLEQFNVSNNNLLNGSVPVDLRSFDVSSYLGTDLCGGPLKACVSGEENDPIAGIGNGGEKGVRRKKKLSGGAIAGIAIGCVLVSVLIVLVVFLLCRKKNVKQTSSFEIATLKHLESETLGNKGVGEVDSGGVVVAPLAGNGKGEANGAGVKKLVFFGNTSTVFDLEDLLRASAEVLGKGTFGTAYKAGLEVGIVVAVKRLRDVNVTEREFKEKIEAVGAMDHENLVPLRAYYYSRDEKLLVYDYMAMGSLSALLHGNKGAGRTPLNWELRSGIALGTARGIAYLHSHGPDVSHGNIKSSNILLTKSHDARVSDFGLAHLVGPSSTPNRVAGYRAPEVTDPRKVSQKADVYSFGVLLMELLTGKPPTYALLSEEGVDLPRWVQSIVREEWTSEVFDMELLRYQNVEDEMVRLLQLALDCAAQYPDKRPSMSEVTRQIEELCRSSKREDSNTQPDTASDVDDISSR